jgi:hypothetical protein
MYQNTPILATIDYNDLIREQSSFVERSIRNIRFYINIWIPRFLYTTLAKWLIKRLNTRLSKQLLISKGVLSTLVEDLQQFKGKDLSNLIEPLDKLNILNIDFHDFVSKALKRQVAKNIPGLHNTEKLLAETIEIQYDIIRLLKRANKVIPINTSELAKSISAHSFENLQKLNYGR